MLGTSTRRFIAGLASVVVATGLLGLTAPAATSADIPKVGDLFLSPASGQASGDLVFNTHAQCPEGATNIKVSLTGQSIQTSGSNNLVGNTFLSATLPNEQGGFTVSGDKTLKAVFLDYGVTSPSGQYVVNLRCQNSNGGTIYGDFLATLNLVPTGTPGDATYSIASNAVATATELSQPTTPIKVGTATALTATVTPTAAGSVQFKDGATSLGSADVVSGVATKSVTLPAGNRSITAVFTSSDTNAFQNSTSTAKSVVVAGVPAITGTPQVGKSIACTTSAGGTQTFTWTVNGAVSSVTAKLLTVPAAWAAKTVFCTAKFTVGGSNVTQNSTAKKIALGAKLVATVKPKVLGTAKVGKVLTCSKGTWSPAATSYKYQWFRGTVALKGKVASTYKAVAADKGKPISCKVTAIKAGYTSGLAASAARKIL